jgi:hypothetical protein
MYFSITVALAAFPFLVGAVPVHNPRENLLSIPLSKRSMPQFTDNHRRSNKRSSNSSGDISLTNNSPLWSGTIQAGTPSKEFTGRSLFRGSTAVETDHMVCSRLRHIDHRFVALWPFLYKLQRRQYLRSFQEFHREQPDDAI